MEAAAVPPDPGTLADGDRDRATPPCAAAAAEAPAGADPRRWETATNTAGGWRADLSSFMAGAAQTRSARAADAEGVAHRAATMGLAGPQGVELEDRFRDGDPSSPHPRGATYARCARRQRRASWR
eukprot:1501585-Pleurochrysis_carterae.AAC.1